jgi:hypothetical protein
MANSPWFAVLNQMPAVSGIPFRVTTSETWYYVFTIGGVAEMPGEDEEWLQTIADDMEPEDGCLTVCGINEKSTTAFTPLGIDGLKQLMPMYRREPGKASNG